MVRDGIAFPLILVLNILMFVGLSWFFEYEGLVGVSMSICGVLLILTAKRAGDGKTQEPEQGKMSLTDFLGLLGGGAVLAGAVLMIYAWTGILIEFPD